MHVHDPTCVPCDEQLTAALYVIFSVLLAPVSLVMYYTTSNCREIISPVRRIDLSCLEPIKTNLALQYKALRYGLLCVPHHHAAEQDSVCNLTYICHVCLQRGSIMMP